MPKTQEDGVDVGSSFWWRGREYWRRRCKKKVLAWRIPGMAEPGGLPSVGSHRVGHDWGDLAAAAAAAVETSKMNLADSTVTYSSGLRKYQWATYSILWFINPGFFVCIIGFHFPARSTISQPSTSTWAIWLAKFAGSKFLSHLKTWCICSIVWLPFKAYYFKNKRTKLS